MALTKEGTLYRWGGAIVNKGWGTQSNEVAKLEIVDDLKRRKIDLMHVAYSNTLIITGQD